MKFLEAFPQAHGMAASNLAAGWLADQAGAGTRNGYAVMLGFFFLPSLVALSSALLLWRREGGQKGHGLEDGGPVAAITV